MYIEFSTGNNLIEIISKPIFRNMKKLKKLHLDGNHIETIPLNTFEDLTSLEELHLSIIKRFYVKFIGFETSFEARLSKSLFHFFLSLTKTKTTSNLYHMKSSKTARISMIWY